MPWIGIDPGLDGAFCFLSEARYEFFDMPTITLKGSDKSHRELDLHAIISWLKHHRENVLLNYTSEGPLCVAIERQQAMPARPGGPKQGTVSTFRTGYGYGMLIGVLETLGLQYELVAPVSWKRKIMADMPKEKDASRVVARRLYPRVAGDLTLKKHHGRADALLIAHYAQLRRNAA